MNDINEGSHVREYSYRAAQSVMPDDYIEALSAIDRRPFLTVLAGKSDLKAGAVRRHSKGDAIVFEEASHDGLTHNKESINAVAQWMEKHFKPSNTTAKGT